MISEPARRSRLGSRSRVHGAYLTFGLLWLVAAGVVGLQGHGANLLSQAVVAVIAIGLGAITVRLTPTPPPAMPVGPRRGWLHLLPPLALVLVTAVWGWLVNRGQSFGLPGWGFLIVNPTLMVLIPGALLLMMGVRLGDLGLAPGRRSWVVGLLWSAPFLLYALVEFIVTGSPGPARLGMRAFNSLLQNGFSEEFLWRGALQTRLEGLMGAEWAMVIQALLFGLWHTGANLGSFGGDYLAAAAFGIVSQGMFGLAFGLVFRRTGNLLAPTLWHVASHLP